MKKTFLAIASVAIFSVLISHYEEASLANAEDNIPINKKVSSEWVTSGAELQKWVSETKDGTVRVNVIKVDLDEPFVEVDALFGKDGKTGDKQRIKDMALEEDAVAAINGDFFTLNAEGASFGTTIREGELINSPGYIGAQNSFMLTGEGEPYIDRLDFEAKVVSEDGAEFQIFGINKTQYNSGYRYYGNSHENRLHMYTQKWNMNNWVGDSLEKPYAVALIEGGIVSRILNSEPVFGISKDSYVLLGHGTAAEFIQNHLHPGDRMEFEMKLSPDLNLDAVVDGSTLLVEEGQKADISYEITGDHARTAVGYSEDKRYVYLITAEKSSKSVGMSLNELSCFLLDLGIYKAVNFDGGGSTTMVARELGTFNLSDVTEPTYGVERAVPNGLAVFTNAPEGKLRTISANIPEGVLLGEKVPISVNRAFDEYYNPVDVDELDVKWTIPQEVAFIEEDEDIILTFNQRGEFDINYSAQGISNSNNVRVYLNSDIGEIKANEDIIRMHLGETYSPEIEVLFRDGTGRKVPSGLLDWQVKGVNLEVNENGELKAIGSSFGLLVVRYDGFSTSIPVAIGTEGEEKLLDNFDNAGKYIVEGLSEEDSGSFEVTAEGGSLAYDFNLPKAKNIVYLNYGTEGKTLTGEPAVLSLNVKGDNSGHWLRGLLRDSRGQVHYVDFARTVDWTGWKTLEALLPPEMDYPAKLESIYLVQQNSQVNSGQLLFSDLKARDWKKPDETGKRSIIFKLNNNEVIVGEEEITVDQPPYIANGRAYVPLRAVAELFEAEVNWDGQNKRIDVFSNLYVLNFWISEQFMSQNGSRRELDAAPFIANGRTMVPLRVIGESFGMYVEYLSKTGTIEIKN